ncbi:MAG: AMP-binding protein [Oscillospiraceae bacterium]|nr:AMP-binding protein [Oscillospiraceae bacterium]
MNYTYDAENFRRVFERSFTWLAGFRRNVGRSPRKTAMIDPLREESWSYERLDRETNRLARALQAHGVGAGDVVLYQLYNSPQFVCCYIAPQKLGAVNEPANFNLSPGETARLIDRDKPKAYIYDWDVKDMACRALALCRHRPALVAAVDYRGLHPALPEGHRDFDSLLAEYPDEAPAEDFTPDMYAEVTRLGTSGTTGPPKGVPLCNVNEVLSAHDTIMHFPLSSADVTMNMTPWFHRGGLHSGGITPTLYAGASLVILRMFSAKACMDCVEKYGVTFLIGVPSALRQLALRQEKHPADLGRLKGIVTMGSPLEKADCIRFQKLLTPNIFNGYGTTETFWNSFLRPDDLPEMAGTAGRSCTGDEVRLVALREGGADPGDTVPADGVSQGEIIIFAPEKSALSYVGDRARSEERFRNGWFYTRDVGTWDEEHYITILGRKDDMIICMGENIYPAQLEEIIGGFPGVRDCMVVGVPDPSRGESVAAYVVPEDPSLTVQALNRMCFDSDDMASYMCPRYYAFVGELPRNATGKKLHVRLKAQALRDLEEGRLLRP